MSKQKKKIDWEAIETDYRAGIKSLRVMSAEYGISHVAIKKRADKEGWVRDLSAKIKAAAEAKVNSTLVNRSVNTARKVSEKEVIEVAAETQKDLILSHRKDIARGRALAMRLLVELEDMTDHPVELDELGELLRNPDKSGKDRLNDIYRAIIGHPSRVDSMKKLADTLKTLITSEREAFGLESKGPLDGLTDAVKNMTVSFVSAQKPQSA